MFARRFSEWERPVFMFLLFAVLRNWPDIAFAQTALPQQRFWKGRLTVAPDGKTLQYQDGTPFFYLGDTGWELLHRLNREETEKYLENRRQKGFNVIQAVALAEFNGLSEPNAYGDLPLVGRSPVYPQTTPGNDPNNAEAYDYWDHVDFVIRTAAEKGLYVGLLPTWGEWVTPRFGPYYFADTVQSYVYGRFLGQRYRDAQNIIWILGGDRLPNERKEGVAIWRSMAEGIADGINGVDKQDGAADFSNSLMSYHCYTSSSDFFNNDPWIDFHMFGSYHEARDLERAYTVVQKDLQLPDALPVMNSEPAYEAHPLNYKADHSLGTFDAFDVRQIAYWSVFAGAMGHTYGAHPIWIFHDPTKLDRPGFRISWKEAMDLPGAFQMIYLKNLVLSRPFQKRVPDQSLVAEQLKGGAHLQAFRGAAHAFIYTPYGSAVKVNMGKISGAKLAAWWYNPRDGQSGKIGSFKNKGTVSFDPPGEPARGNDWVLVLDDATKRFAAPGTGVKK